MAAHRKSDQHHAVIFARTDFVNVHRWLHRRWEKFNHIVLAVWRAKEAESIAYRMMMKRIAGLYVAWLVVAGLLVYAAVEPHPYSFYELLRWICCPVFAYSAFAAREQNRTVWVWIFGVLAALYNPIFRVPLDRSTWIGVNWFTVGAIVVAIVVFLWGRSKTVRGPKQWWY